MVDAGADFSRITGRFADILARLDGDVGKPVIARESDHMASPHVERHGSTWHYVVCERGAENQRIVCRDDEEVLYLLTRDVVQGEGWNHELAHRVEGADVRRAAFARMIAQMGRVSPEWQARFQAEIDAILARAPYTDEPAAAEPEERDRSWIGLAIVSALVLAVVTAHYPLWQRWHAVELLAAEGEPVTAMVTARDISYPKIGQTYHLDYQYRVGGRAFERSEVVEKYIWDRYGEGGPVTVRVARSDPTIAAVAPEDAFARALAIYGVIDLLLLALIAGGVWRARRSPTA